MTAEEIAKARLNPDNRRTLNLYEQEMLSIAYLGLLKKQEGHEHLKKFYQVDSFYDLIEAQDGHIGKLQAIYLAALEAVK